VIEPDRQERYTAEAWERHALRAGELEQRLKVVRAEARAKGIDSSRLDASIERRILAYERRVRAA
jgi:transposase